MQADELITKADRFAHDFIKELSDTNNTVASRQAYMLDNQERLQKIMGSLQTVITALGAKEEKAPLDEDDETMLEKGNEIVQNLRSALDAFREELKIDEDTKEEDIVPVVNEQTISDAMNDNSTTKKMAADLKNVQEQQLASSSIPFNYAMSCDGVITLIKAKDKDELNKTINDIANKGKYSEIKLFKLMTTPVPLHQKTVLSV